MKGKGNEKEMERKEKGNGKETRMRKDTVGRRKARDVKRG